MSLKLCLMVCLISKCISWSDIAFDMNTAMVSFKCSNLNNAKQAHTHNCHFQHIINTFALFVPSQTFLLGILNCLLTFIAALWIIKKIWQHKMLLLKSIILAMFTSFQQIFATLNCGYICNLVLFQVSYWDIWLELCLGQLKTLCTNWDTYLGTP